MNTKTETPAATAAALAPESKIVNIEQNLWFRTAAFALSVGGGFLCARLLYFGFTVLHTLGGGAEKKAGPLVSILDLFRSGLGN